MNQSKTPRAGWSLTAAVTAAIAASICCLGPLLLVALGAGGAWASKLTAFEPFRPVFITLTVAFLVFGFYRAYRPAAAEGCRVDGSCAVPGSRRLNRVTLWIATPLLLGLLVFPYFAPHLFAQKGVTMGNSAGAKRVVLKLQNMDCPACSVTVRESLAHLQGVKDVQVTSEPPQAVVSYDAAKVSPVQLTEATKNAGYPSFVKEESMSLDCCQTGKSPSLQSSAEKRSSMTQTTLIDPSHEVLFKVSQLKCHLVDGVGCGHLLAPRMEQMNRVEGVSASFSNWTGTMLRVTASPTADREAVAERVQKFLVEDGQNPVRVSDSEVASLLNSDEWRDISRVAELSSFEFRIVAKRRINTFAENEKLDSTQREKLLSIADGVWDKSSVGLDAPKPGAAAYSSYWQSRREKFVSAYVEQVRGVLTPEQVKKLIRDYGPHEQ